MQPVTEPLSSYEKIMFFQRFTQKIAWKELLSAGCIEN